MRLNNIKYTRLEAKVERKCKLPVQMDFMNELVFIRIVILFFSQIMRHGSKFTCVRDLNVRITMNLVLLLLIARPAIFRGYYIQMIRFT